MIPYADLGGDIGGDGHPLVVGDELVAGAQIAAFCGGIGLRDAYPGCPYS